MEKPTEREIGPDYFNKLVFQTWAIFAASTAIFVWQQLRSGRPAWGLHHGCMNC
jgi:hypothetical protein